MLILHPDKPLNPRLTKSTTNVPGYSEAVMSTKNSHAITPTSRRFGSDLEVERLTGISRSTLRTDRFFGRQRFPWYKVGRRVLYDLAEVESIIRSTRQGAAVANNSASGARVEGQ